MYRSGTWKSPRWGPQTIHTFVKTNEFNLGICLVFQKLVDEFAISEQRIILKFEYDYLSNNSIILSIVTSKSAKRCAWKNEYLAGSHISGAGCSVLGAKTDEMQDRCDRVWIN